MKKIKAKFPASDPPLVFDIYTLLSGEEIRVFDERILKSSDVINALREGKIEIVDEP